MTDLVPLKRVASLRPSNVDKKSREGEASVRLCNYTDVYYYENIRPDMEFMPATATHDQLRDFSLRHGDVIMTKDSETADDVGIPAFVEHPPTDLVCGYHLTLIRPNQQQLDGRFLFWQMSATHVRQTWEATAAGVTRVGLRAETVANLPIRVPCLTAQQAIANYLDTETARIDAIVTKKQRLQERLEERFKATIESRLLATGNRIPLRRLLREAPQYGASESGEPLIDGHPRYVRITDMTSDGRLKQAGAKSLDPVTAQPYLLQDGDVLVARSGATAGKSFIYRETMGQACYAGYLIRLRFSRRMIDPSIVHLWMQTHDYEGQITGSAVQATIKNVNAERYKDLLVPVPPPEVQNSLLAELKSEDLRVHQLGEVLVQQIALLREHRQALITAAVTGELEVPGVAA